MCNSTILLDRVQRQKRHFKFFSESCLVFPCDRYDLTFWLTTMSQFTSRRELLNPFFEGYRLSIIPQEDAVSRCSLADHAATQSRASNKTLLTFKEMQSRIAHNHLAGLGNQAVYVDAEFNLIAIDLEPVSRSVL